MRTELKFLLKSCLFSAAVLFTGASASADEYILTVVPVENDENQFQIECMNIDKGQTDALSVIQDLYEKQVFLKTPPSGEVAVNLNTPEDHTSFSFKIGSFKFFYTFGSTGGVMKITGGDERDSLQIQNRVDSQTFEIDTVKANMLSITRGSWKTEIIRMRNCNANTVLLGDYDIYLAKMIPLLQTSGENYIHNLILNGARILNDGTVKVDGVFCNINGSITGCLPSVLLEPSHSQNAFILRDKDLINNASTLEEVDSTSKNCTFFSDTSGSRVEHKDSFYELPDIGCYRFILLGCFRCSEKGCEYALLREQDFHPVAPLSEVFGTYLRLLETPAGGKYQRGTFVSLFKNVKSVNLQIGEALEDDSYQPCELKCASIGHALVIIREDGLHQEPRQEESSPFLSNEIKNQLIYQF